MVGTGNGSEMRRFLRRLVAPFLFTLAGVFVGFFTLFAGDMLDSFFRWTQNTHFRSGWILIVAIPAGVGLVLGIAVELYWE